MTNVGMRPTFNGSALTVETHLLDFRGEIPAKRIEVRFWERLREEKKFNGAEELREQIARDIDRANRFFTSAQDFANTAASLPNLTLTKYWFRRVGYGCEGN